MKDIKLLDCTLRDGGYLNDWKFGHSTITCVFERLVYSGVDAIEVGFLDERRTFDMDRTIQPTTECYDRLFADCDKGNATVFAMIDYGTCGIENIGPCAESFLDGIRIIFKKPNMRKAVEFARLVAAKGYLVTLQLVSITSYNDRDILELVELINELKPYAVSMVDTYGLMHKEEMSHYFHLLDHNLDPDIIIGYHSHNNFQLGYANEIEMVKRDTPRVLLTDGTVYGMGKSAGNAPLELLALYLNEHYGKHYCIDQILEIIDVNIMRIYRKHYWGYSLLFYLAASNDCHPNYINYLLSKNTLSVKSINDIAGSMDVNKRLDYDQSYIEGLYRRYQESMSFESETIRNLGEELAGRELLLLGPGRSILTEKEKIDAYIAQRSPVIIAVNCIPQEYAPDYVFVGNAKRYSSLFQSFLRLDENCKVIATSNIAAVNKPFDYVFRYDEVRDEDKVVEDNAFIMMLRILSMTGVKAVSAAGFDGFSPQMADNYYDQYLDFETDYSMLAQVNEAVRRRVAEMRPDMEIRFLTKSLYED